MRYFSGKFEGFQSDKTKDPGIVYDLVKEYKFADIVHLDSKPALEMLNSKLQLMKDYEFALNLDTDEILEGNWQDFEDSMKISKQKYPNDKLLSVPFEDKTGIYEFEWLHKLYYMPETLEFRFAHMWFFDKITNKKIEPNHGLRGIKIIQDDFPRPDWRERLQCRYQQWNRRQEIKRQQKFYQDEIKRGNIKGRIVEI